MPRKTWFITGAGRGMGVGIAKAALAAGDAVVATGRTIDAVAKAVGTSDDLLVVKLDVTSRADAEAAVRTTLGRFGRIDVLVNNAGNFKAGYFEELAPEQFEQQLAATLLGPMNVTRAVLPTMRKQARDTSSRSRRPRVSSASSSVPPTLRRSSASRVGWNRCAPRSRRSAFTPPSSTLGSFAPNS
jgi:NAD(P)-dependent dehydrogenase (short-subunit alcohol dehydrogenase family)